MITMAWWSDHPVYCELIIFNGEVQMNNYTNLYTNFKQKAEAISAQVFRASSMSEANELISNLLKEYNAHKVVLSHSSLSRTGKLDEALAEQGFQVHTTNLRKEAPTADVGISQLDFAIAETGTLAQDASNVDSRLVSTLPLIHVALVPIEALTATFGEAMTTLYNGGNVPGYINFITGPSRTSDIERVLTIGVHGPEKLLIVFVDQGGQA
jgi:L-lactate dehydrogenase complex protein LldG